MTLKPPFVISPRLLPAVEINGASISIQYAGETRDGRRRYSYYIDLMDTARTTYFGDDLKSGCGGGTLQEGMASLLSFLSHAGEGYRYQMQYGRSDFDPESWSFPQPICEWAYLNSDELAMLQIEIEESPGELIEE